MTEEQLVIWGQMTKAGMSDVESEEEDETNKRMMILHRPSWCTQCVKI